ncbi:MAG: hypothetical protein IJW32_01170 [Clostridia bacterium]|nr:hypothetical protein [Clostridia bacterium]
MTVLEVLKMVSLYLNLYDNFKPLFEGSSLSANEDEVEFQKILSGINLTLKSLSCLFKLKTKEEISIGEDKSFNLSLLSKPLNQICVIKDLNNKSHPCKIYNDKFLTDFSGKAYIEYFYFPANITSINDKIEINSKVSIKTFAIGVVCEYCYINNLFDDAFVWEERFNKSLKTKTISSSFLMPSKRWL